LYGIYLYNTTMSQASLSAARKRRAPASVANAPTNGRGQISGLSTMSPPSSAPSQMNASQGLTLAQVITLVDKRLTTLETQIRENADLQPNANTAVETAAIPNNITEVLDEFNERFEALADELANLKNVVLSLQSYTMDVNKTLLQERIRILGDDHTSTSVTAVDSSQSSWAQELTSGR
jgi:conjugal transfer/entry exclusion protein